MQHIKMCTIDMRPQLLLLAHECKHQCESPHACPPKHAEPVCTHTDGAVDHRRGGGGVGTQRQQVTPYYSHII